MTQIVNSFELSKSNRKRIINQWFYEWYNHSRNQILVTQLCKIYKHDDIVSKVWSRKKDWYYLHSRILNWIESNHYISFDVQQNFIWTETKWKSQTKNHDLCIQIIQILSHITIKSMLEYEHSDTQYIKNKHRESHNLKCLQWKKSKIKLK